MSELDQDSIVYKVEEGLDRRDVFATTYQMRNPFQQFADGVVTELDVHCYFQHLFAANLCPPGGRVLDVCCGRGLLIPFLRYRVHQPSLYVGVDIAPQNARWAKGADPRREKNQKTDWGFPRAFVKSNAASMGPPLLKLGYAPFDLIVYTSSIEHMQPELQRESLKQCAMVAKASTPLYLTCPVTEEGEEGYDAQYAAHVYEPKESELNTWLTEAGWKVTQRIGLSTKTSKFRNVLKGSALETAEHIYNIMPRQQALPTIAALFPNSATEIAYKCFLI